MKRYLEYVLRKEKKAVSYDRIVEHIERLRSFEGNDKLTTSEKEEILQLLEDGVNNYDIYKTPQDNYILMTKTSFRKGKFYGDRGGSGKVSVTTSYTDKEGKLVVNEDKYPISKGFANGAIDGDIVLIDLGGKGLKPKVVSILNRQLDYIPGEVYRMGNSYFVKPIDKRKQNIIIALQGEAIEGERVAVSLLEQTSDNFYIGKIIKTFNHKDDPDEDILWEAFKHGIDNEFSPESIEQLDYIPTEVRDIDRIGREDLTDWEIFTIDGLDTKDMDDAVSLKINEKGNYVLGVHITDLPSIVPENSPLDKDAFKKGNSCYAGGTVFPMYPHKISNGIGSLNPYVDRLTVSTIMEFTPEGKLVNSRISPTVIRSCLKMNYKAVNDVLKNGIVSDEYKEHEKTLNLMRKLAYVLRKNRILGGSQEFNRPELSAYRDKETGKVKLKLRVQDVGENLIEEFMIAANICLAHTLNKNGLPCVHRIHEAPNEEKVINLLNLLAAINLPFKKYSASELVENKKAYQELNHHIEGSGRLSSFLSCESIKCMSRAKYSAYNCGHNGLGVDEYTHGTSPARRYADTTNLRIAHECLFNNKDREKNIKKWKTKLPAIAEQTTRCERLADDTERDVLRMLYCEEMEDHIGEEFDATVIGISGECMVVQLDDMREGTVRVRNLKGEYVYSPESYSLVSIDGYDNYYIGDRLHLKLKCASKENRKIDFIVLEKINETNIVNSDKINNDVKVKIKEDRRR